MPYNLRTVTTPNIEGLHTPEIHTAKYRLKMKQMNLWVSNMTGERVPRDLERVKQGVYDGKE